MWVCCSLICMGTPQPEYAMCSGVHGARQWHALDSIGMAYGIESGDAIAEPMVRVLDSTTRSCDPRVLCVRWC